MLQEADHQAGNGDPVEVWAGNGHGLRRLVIASGPDRSPRFLLPHVSHYAGDPARAAAAVAAWRRLSAQWGAAPAPNPEGSPPVETPADSQGEPSFAPAGTPTPGATLTRPADGPPTAGLVPTGPQTEALTTALQEALGQVRVEVDLGAIEDLVADSLRSALAELPESALAPYAERLGTDGNPVAPPAGPSRAAGRSPRTPSTDLEISAPYGIPAVSADGPPPDEQGRQHAGAFPREDLERLVRSSVAAAVDATLADRLPELVRMLASSTPRRRGAAPEPTAAPSQQALDPVDVARRVAASVLSPAEIAETLLFRMRPLLDEHNERATHRASTEAERDRLALEQTRTSLNRLAERMDRRLDRLEGEVRRQGPAAADPYPDRSEKGAPGAEPDASAGSATLRVLRPDDGR